jgi:hypothetical protein
MEYELRSRGLELVFKQQFHDDNDEKLGICFLAFTRLLSRFQRKLFALFWSRNFALLYSRFRASSFSRSAFPFALVCLHINIQQGEENQDRAGRTGKAEWDRQNGTAEKDRQNGTGPPV